MPEFKIRSAKPGDEASIHEAHMRSIREICIKDHGENEIRGWGYRPLGNRWIDAIKNDYVWVVEFNDCIFGHAYIRIFEENGEKRGHIHGLYLTPEALGKGIGGQLGRLMLDSARNSGADLVTLDATITAHEFYKRLGFTDSGPMKSQEIAGHPVRYFPMFIRLK